MVQMSDQPDPIDTETADPQAGVDGPFDDARDAAADQLDGPLETLNDGADEADLEAESETETESELETEAKTELAVEDDYDADAESDAETETESDAESETEAESAPGAARRRLRLRRPAARSSRTARRALLLTALGGLLTAGVVAAVPIIGDRGGVISYLGIEPTPAVAVKTSGAFSRVVAGDCLTWPEATPEAVEAVDCATEHRFEVAEVVDMRAFPGAEYSPDAAPPSPQRLAEIGREQCERAVHRYLGPRFDPNGRFTIGMLWSGDKAWHHAGERRMLCGMRLPGPNDTQELFTGRVAEQDQSQVWPVGTCLGIDPATNQPSDVPIDCAAPHAMEVTGIVNLADRFPGVLPSEPDQDAFIKEVCTRLTEDYLAPVQLRNTTLTLLYSTISLPSWTAGSRQLSCSIGMTLGDGGWATLLNSAKGDLLINGQPPIPPPEIPAERLNLPSLTTG